MKVKVDKKCIPDGYEAVEFRVPEVGDIYLSMNGDVLTGIGGRRYPRLILRRKVKEWITLHPDTAVKTLHDLGSRSLNRKIRSNKISLAKAFYLLEDERERRLSRFDQVDWRPTEVIPEDSYLIN